MVFARAELRNGAFCVLGGPAGAKLVSAVRRRAMRTPNDALAPFTAGERDSRKRALCGKPHGREVSVAATVYLVMRDPNLEYGQAPLVRGLQPARPDALSRGSCVLNSRCRGA